MPMEQAKWYTIHFVHRICMLNPKGAFYCKLLAYFLKNDGIKRISKLKVHSKIYYSVPGFKPVRIYWYEFHIFCGRKKLNKLIEEAHLLGLEDELLIFERR